MNTNPADEHRLLAAFQKGDSLAFDTLFHRYAARLLAFALRLNGGGRADAEDLVQETFVAAYRGAAGFRSGSRLMTWLLGIMMRRRRDNNRQRRLSTVALIEEHDDLPLAPSAEESALNAVAFRCALGSLDIPLREAFLLVVVQGMTHREAATILDAPVGTVKWRVAEATRRLRHALKGKDDETA